MSNIYLETAQVGWGQIEPKYKMWVNREGLSNLDIRLCPNQTSPSL